MKKIMILLTIGLVVATQATVVTYNFDAGLDDSTSGSDLTAGTMAYAVGSNDDGAPNSIQRAWDPAMAPGDYLLQIGQRGTGNSGISDAALEIGAASQLTFELTPNAGEALDFSAATLSFDSLIYSDSAANIAFAYKVWAETGSGFEKQASLQSLSFVHTAGGTGSHLRETDKTTVLTTAAPLTDGAITREKTALVFDITSLGVRSVDQSVTFAITLSGNRNNQFAWASGIDNLIVDFSPALKAPTDLASDAFPARVELDWNAESSATSYNVYRSETSAAYDAILTNVTASAYSDTNVINNTTYYYVVSAVNASSTESAVSAEVSATPIDTPPILDSGYDGWAASFGQIGGQTDDDDGDGLSNIHEFGLGGNPTNSTDMGYEPTLDMMMDSGTNWMHYVHVRRTDPDSGIDYVLEENPDLMTENWTTANSEKVGSAILPADPDFESVTNRIPTTETNKFIRLKILSDLPPVYGITSPEDLGDGIAVGTLDVPGTTAAVQAFIDDDNAGKYENLDSLLIWKDGKLIFERYNRAGGIDVPHYMMSVTKTMTSVVLARAIQLGYLHMDDLDKPVIDFMPELDRSSLQTGVETITLRDALFMKSGIRLASGFENSLSEVKQAYWQKIFENTEPITPESKLYKYSGINPEMILMILDIKTGDAHAFIQTELSEKMGANYSWPDNHGTPKGGAGSYFTSRFLIKVGVAVLNGGMHAGEQWLSPDYVDLIMDTNKGAGYFYYFHNRVKFGFPDINFISGIGAGGQYMSIYPNDNIVIAATTTTASNIASPLIAIEDHFVDLLMER